MKTNSDKMRDILRSPYIRRLHSVASRAVMRYEAAMKRAKARARVPDNWWEQPRGTRAGN